MFPPGDGGGGDPSAALQKQKTQQPRRPMMQGGGFRPPGLASGGPLGGTPARGGPPGGGFNMTPPGQNPMMPRGMGGMGAPPTLGGQVPPPAQRMAMMRNQNRPPELGQTGQMAGGLMQAMPYQAPGFDMEQARVAARQGQNQDPMMQQKMQQAQTARRGMDFGSLPFIGG